MNDPENINNSPEVAEPDNPVGLGFYTMYHSPSSPAASDREIIQKISCHQCPGERQ